MILQNLHTHTAYCDGKDTVREMVEQAIALGFETLGFSGHSYTAYNPTYCMSREDTIKYCSEVHEVAREYADKIRILCGIEQDFYAADPPFGFDYIIGSIHAVEKNGEYIEVDYKPEILRDGVNRLWNGDFYAFCEDYYALMPQLIEKTNADIIGHFDLPTKFLEIDPMFDPLHPRYVEAAKYAADALLESGKLFEINTCSGAIVRGYRSSPYPADWLIEYIGERGGKFVVSSDCHDRRYLSHYFAEVYEKYDKYITYFR